MSNERSKISKGPLLRLVAFLTMLGLTTAAAQTYDLVIRGGRVIDGAGGPAYFADVAVKRGKIAAVGKFGAEADTVIDAKGLIVAPGFIDVHTHAEEITDLPMAENFVRMGVTTLVLGNCGSSTLDVAGFFSRLEATNVSVNVATLIGHGSVRGKAMGGSFLRPPTAEERAEMKSLVRQAMREGALGLSTGLIYLPGAFAKTEEIIEVAKVVAEFDGIYASHMRSESREIFGALDELFRIAREADVRAQVSHVKLSGKTYWGQASRVLAAIERARQEGLDITQDQYVYTASSTGLSQLIPEESREGNLFKERLKDPAAKAKIVAEIKENLIRGGRDDFAYAVIADYKEDRSLNGLNIVEAARRLRGAATVEDQIELILEVHLKGGASAVFHGISEEDLETFLAHPNTMFASDSGVRRFNQGVPHPRGYGNAARVLARYVRELKRLRLEEAVRRMTSLPAATFRLEDRGQLRVGNWADIVVFDPAKVQDLATFEEPHRYATGFAAVLVNGVVAVRDDRQSGQRPGRVVRRGGSP